MGDMVKTIQKEIDRLRVLSSRTRSFIVKTDDEALCLIILAFTVVVLLQISMMFWISDMRADLYVVKNNVQDYHFVKKVAR